jgi:putative cell wall-binding protein
MKIELLELRKELVVATDFAEELTREEKEQLEEAKNYYEEGYAKLSEEDKNWLDNQFNEWLEFYLSDECGSGCSSCGCSCPSH